MTLQDSFTDIVKTLEHTSGVDQVIVQAFLNRIKAEPRLTRDEGVSDHLCSFLIPVHQESGHIFIGHHKKADSWIPPGGHIDKGELPIQAVRREFEEELNHKITDEKIELLMYLLSRLRTDPVHVNFTMISGISFMSRC